MNLNKLYPLITSILLASVWYSCQPEPDASSGTDNHAAYLALSLEERQEAQNATGSFETAEGLKATLFAGEPMVINPTNMAIDERGRVWVCESYNYAVPEKEQTEKGGRIIILTDTDGDGRADERKVYYQGEDVHLALGINKLGRHLYVSRSPNLLVFTDLDGDDLPDRKDTLFTGMGNPGDHSAHALVFGPDGRFYFNYGNAGKQVLLPDGTPAVDYRSGRQVVANGQPYHGGMIFRCEPDGSKLEVLAHNFRNNYEVAVDAFGSLWQSDNDDDGNRSVRINYIQEYGNYGYLDERTGAHWSAVRTGMHDSIPQRHWHQNDPGVVPNMLITGAGSPAGITVYEGELLPERFRGQLIHADAGPNVVRAYPVRAQGAGYRAETLPLLKSPYDQWFRPVDVATAPDGSLMIADWYDPIVGGAAAGDHEKGRIFRLAPTDTSYRWSEPDLSTIPGAITGLQNPNESVRYLAWQTLHEAGAEAEPALLELWKQQDRTRHRARALWLLGQLPGKGNEYVGAAIRDAEEMIRISGLRLARRLEMDLLPVARQLVRDPSPAVRAELAIALRHTDGTEAAAIWAELAEQYDGADRWYLEALGIGADPHWETFFSAWLDRVGEGWKQAGGRDIIWRSRSRAAAPLLADLIADPQTSETERLRYFRAFDYHSGKDKNKALLGLLEADHPRQDAIDALVLQHLETEDLVRSPALNNALQRTLDNLKGGWQYVDLVARYQLRGRKEELLQIAASSGEPEAAALAAGVLIDPATFDGMELIKERIYTDDASAPALIRAIRATGRKSAFELLQSIVLDSTLSLETQKAAVTAMSQTWTGEDYLLASVQDEAFPDALKPMAASILFSVYRTSIHEEAAAYLDRPANIREEELPPIRVLAATVGNAVRGRALFENQCQICHRVNGQGVQFGPDLSDIGNKLDKAGLYRSILYPNEGVNYGYETYKLSLRSGGVVVGLLASETETAMDLKIMGGDVQSYPRSDIADLEKMDNSLMPNISLAMEQEELIDLVEYLAALGVANTL
ncbi:PVC-type heme-binding CxxCH protein [Flavilitoribacter nigricans]|uniref:Dehydrogenase n=1 Tax=Flavilitoribacter nigricans (strain ATCC 23147 / DSM 23189 / NBRC 102662 / NCIMB 1420 / SS-2) TaxID=1122177 RepID=A0A2D0NIE9_FLAN2|nr:PVC-type heme-binding CxxCH protein [Flavilitoribacter nigricans]PHN08274.1 dehydrogenase [Flavilitoribacter nigricans DSM 23189 = NBRC 102662]